MEYPLIAFPWEPWVLTAWGELTQAQAGVYADWLNGSADGRVAVILAVLGEAGAPVAGLRERPENLAVLGGWVQEWFPVVAAPLVEQRFISDDTGDRLGGAWAAWGPALANYSRYGDELLHSLAHDLAFLVADCARRARPGLRWQAAFDGWRKFFATIDPGPQPFDVVAQVKDFLLQSVSGVRGTRSREWRRWYGQALYRCYRRAATGVAPPAEEELFPDRRERSHPRYELTRPVRADAAASRELIEAVSAFRQAGWFERNKLDDADLARAAQVAWRKFEREDIPADHAEICWRLLLLDTGRTWSEDVEYGPGGGRYGGALFGIDRIGGKGFGHFRDPEGDWAATPGDVQFSFEWSRTHRRHQLPIPASGPYISPALFTGLNALLPPGRQRLWFFDHGPPIGIVTRATAAERTAVSRSLQ